MSFAALLDRAAMPLDSVRRAALGVALRDRRVARVVTERDRRLALMASVHAAVALALSVFVPVVLVVLGPVLLGVAHVAADVRYLVLRRALPRWWQAAILGFCAALLGVRALVEGRVVPGGLDRTELGLVTTWVLTGLLAGCRERRSTVRAAVGALVVVPVAIVALRDPRGARLVFAQLHNLVAIVLWVGLFRGRPRAMALPVALVLGAAGLLASGAFYGVTLHHGLVRSFGVHLFQAADWVAPDLRADYAVGFTSAYAFLQSVHYVVWLSLIPQDDATGRGLSSFRSSLRSLVRDFGGPGLLLVVGSSLAVLVGALFGASRARGLYLSLTLFHGYLELALLAYFWGRGRFPVGRPA